MKTWENHQIDGINKMPARAHFLTFPTREKALLGSNGYTHAFKNLNGVWKFMFLDAPEYSPEGFYASDFDTTYEYTVCPTGDVLIRVSGVPGGKLEDTAATLSANGSSANMTMGGKLGCAPDMFPRIGVTMHLDKSMENVRFFGRGPRENYSDSKEAGLMGVYENTVDGLSKSL